MSQKKEISENISKNLKLIMKEWRLSGIDIANMAETSSMSVYNWLAGKKQMRTETYILLKSRLEEERKRLSKSVKTRSI